MQFSVLRAETYQLRNRNCQCFNESSCLGSRANTFLLKYLGEVFLFVCVLLNLPPPSMHSDKFLVDI